MLPGGPCKELIGVVQIEKLGKSISVAWRDANKILGGGRVGGGEGTEASIGKPSKSLAMQGGIRAVATKRF